MKSMTGYGYREMQNESHQISVELKSYNNRYLDININVPSSLGILEPRLREYLSSRLNRGRVELTIRYRQISEELTFSVDTESVIRFSAFLNELKITAGIDDPLKLDHLLKMNELIKYERHVDPEAAWSGILTLLAEAHGEYEEGRIREGNQTELNILKQLDIVIATTEFIESRSADLEELIQANIRERFTQVLGDTTAEERVLAETAVLLIKFSINEELERLSGHIGEFKRTLEQGEQPGKKLDFICQELQREVNTIGSKSTLFEVNRAVVEAKDGIEKIREQLKNVE